MNYKYQYNSEDERLQILEQHKEKFLKEEQNLLSGNFLIFTDVKPIEIEVLDLKSELEATQQALDFLLMGGM